MNLIELKKFTRQPISFDCILLQPLNILMVHLKLDFFQIECKLFLCSRGTRLIAAAGYRERLAACVPGDNKKLNIPSLCTFMNIIHFQRRPTQIADTLHLLDFRVNHGEKPKLADFSRVLEVLDAAVLDKIIYQHI